VTVTEDYLKYWGMTKPPFSLTPDPEMLYLSGQHSECLMRLKYAVFSHKGGALLVSDNAGNGKTSILNRLKNDLNDYYSGRVIVVFIDHPTLSPIEMIGEIGRQLGTELQTTEKIRALNSLRDRLFSLYNENVKVIVIVDEGQMLRERADILEELRILLNFCVSDAFLLTFIFSGQKPLDGILREMPEFWQRLPVRFFLKNLDYNDTKSLIQFRLGKVGIVDDIFNDDAFEGIYNYTKGCPRIICSVADLCLIIGFARGIRRIGFVEVSNACRDMESSGDGYHYYAYLKAQQYDLFTRPGPAQPLPDARLGNEKRRESLSPPPVREGLTTACPRCAELNPKELKFCASCGASLYLKCPQCLTLIETFTGECPVCHTDMDRERRRLIEEFLKMVKPFDILEGGDALWLQANGLSLGEGETALLILPQGNFMRSSPVVQVTGVSGKPKPLPCDVILTDRRFLLRFGDTTAGSELAGIDACTVSPSGKLFGARNILLITFGKETYSIMFPYSAVRAKKLMNRISHYIQSVMVK